MSEGSLRIISVPGQSSGGADHTQITDNAMLGNPSLIIRNDGKVGIGISNASNWEGTPYKLYVKGGIRTERVKIDVASTIGWADYVFNDNYKLNSLQEVEVFVRENKHLPGIPSVCEIEDNGLDLGEMVTKQMQKIEELILYLIAQQKEIKELKKMVAAIKPDRQ